MPYDHELHSDLSQGTESGTGYWRNEENAGRAQALARAGLKISLAAQVARVIKCNNPDLGGSAGRTGEEMQQSRLRWQCRRGMRELDELLLDYLNQHYAAADDQDKEAFRALLELSDPELIGYLLQCVKPAAESLARVVDRILNRSPA